MVERFFSLARRLDCDSQIFDDRSLAGPSVFLERARTKVGDKRFLFRQFVQGRARSSRNRPPSTGFFSLLAHVRSCSPLYTSRINSSTVCKSSRRFKAASTFAVASDFR